VRSRIQIKFDQKCNEEIMPTTLDQMNENRKARVIDIQGGAGIRQRLSQMGIHPGDEITMLRFGALWGPILIEVHGSQVALGRGIASKVIIEETE
jgi:ferrous iron transport protein A